MKRTLSCLALGITALTAGTAMADITFYETENFGGRRISANQPIVNFDDARFNDRAHSVVVDNESWELCVDADFRGGCTVLAPGRYPSMSGLSGRVSSARPVGSAPVVGSVSGGITFYETENFGGRSFRVDNTVPNFGGMRYNDRAQSAIVDGGQWEICVDAEFRGDCRVFVPGRYPNLGGLAGRVSSARPSIGTAESRRGGRGYGQDAGRATLYEGPNMTGRSFVVTGDVMANLDGTRFNDRASSVRVDRGYWLFCSDANFQGVCRTFGPGDYPALAGLDNSVSSARRISNDYPYNQNPNWQR